MAGETESVECQCAYPLLPCLYAPPLDPEEIQRKEHSDEIDKQLAKERQSFRQTHRLLLLGAGESGKSTIIKQMQIIHVDKFSETEREQRRADIRSNLLEAIISIVSAMTTLNPPIEFANSENSRKAQWLLEHGTKTDFEFCSQFYDYTESLWKDEGVQAAFRRSNEYQLIDSAQYFLDKVHIIRQHNYLPSEQDILRCRVLTRQIYELVFHVNNAKFLMIDVGGQRGERRKWFLCFHDVTAIIFVVACSAYNLTLREDPSKNRLCESLDIFKTVWKNRYLQNVSVILFLNKQDIFTEKILAGKSKLEDYFPGFVDFNTPSDVPKNNEHPEVVRAKYFIRNEFVKISSTTEKNQLHQCFPHFTCAIDTENIKHVFEDCRKIIQWSYLIQYNLC